MGGTQRIAERAGIARARELVMTGNLFTVRAQSDHGTRGADDRTAELTSHLFETRDSREAVKSFLQSGPGKADFTGE